MSPYNGFDDGAETLTRNVVLPRGLPALTVEDLAVTCRLVVPDHDAEAVDLGLARDEVGVRKDPGVDQATSDVGVGIHDSDAGILVCVLDCSQPS